MNINCFSVTFWFNIFENHTEILKLLSEELKDEFSNFNIFNANDENLISPVITAINHKTHSSIFFSKINFRFNMDHVEKEDFTKFKTLTLKLFEILTDNQINVLHSALFINAELVNEDALKLISQNTLKKHLITDDLIDMSLKIGQKYEDLFYKIITILNKKQVKFNQKADAQGRLIPLPLTSLYDSYASHELIDISYEINDKYSFDFTKNYHTTEFYLNKMLYLLENNFESDISKLLKNVKF